MGSVHEELALTLFSLKSGVPLVRKKMKKAILASVNPKNAIKDDELIDSISQLKRTPDAVAILSKDEASALGLDPIKTILFCEAEYSSPIPLSTLEKYADLYDMSHDGYDFSFAVVVIERYGRYQFIDLDFLYTAVLFARKTEQGAP
jgi:hypothetical protein